MRGAARAQGAGRSRLGQPFDLQTLCHLAAAFQPSQAQTSLFTGTQLHISPAAPELGQLPRPAALLRRPGPGVSHRLRRAGFGSRALQ